MYFINAKIGGFALDFENTVASDADVYGYGGIASQAVYGQVNELPAGQLYDDFTMLWEVGQSYTDTPLMIHCEYDNEVCYQARSVPVIYEVSSDTTYVTGG